MAGEVGAGLALVSLMFLALAACQPADERAGPPPDQAGVEAETEEAQGVARDDQQIGELIPGATIEHPLSPGELHVYSLALERDDFVEIEVEQLGVDVLVSLLDPQRQLLLEVDLPIADLGPERLLAVAEQAGSYELEVRAWGESETSDGSYRISWRLERPVKDADRLRAEAAKIFSGAQQLYSSKEFDEALVFYSDSLDLWLRAKDEFWQAETLDRMGSAYWKLGQWRQAVEARRQAAALFRSLGESRFEAISLSGVGSAWFELGELERASRHHMRALELRRQVGDTRGLAIALFSLADIYRIQGETQKALDHFSRALQLFGPEDRRYRGAVLSNLGTLYHLAGKREVAMDRLREAESLFADLDVRRQAFVLSRIGQLSFELGNHDQALEILGRALGLHRQVEDLFGQADDLRRIGSVQRALGDPEMARRHYLQALDLLRGMESPRKKASVLASLGSLYVELDRAEEALASHREAYALFEKANDLVGQAECLLGAAVAERRLGVLEAALDAGERALTIAENLRVKPFSEDLRFSFFSTVQRFFEFYIDLLMDLHRKHPAAGHAAEALKSSERSRARSLLDLLGEATAEIRGDAAPELLAEERALQRRLNATVGQTEAETSAKNMREIVRRLDAVRAEIRRRSPRYADLTQPRPLSLDRIQQQVLDRETILLEYKLGSKRSFLWLVGRETFVSFELAPGAEIERSVRRVYSLLVKGYRRESEVLTRRLLCDLSAKLLQPVAGRLGRKRLAVVAEGELQYLPFAALPDPDSPLECSEAPPLVANHEIVHLPSASTLAVLRSERESHVAPAGLVAVLADPVFAPDDERIEPVSRDATASIPAQNSSGVADQRRYRRLHFSRKEAESILRLVPPGLGYLALDFDASKETVVSGRLADYRIVHFATHGIPDPQQTEMYGIVLSLVDRLGQPVDGFLRAHEIYNLRLPADLVVLGACETALGKDVKGEGLVGLARGFMYAGASRVIVSLWRVSDRGTSELMTAFYRALLEQRLAPAAALREAQLAVREEKRHPYFWAGFVLEGEWRGSEKINNEQAKGS